VTIVATPDAGGTPPHVDVEVSVTPGSVMSSVAVWRNDHNGRTLLRTQPAAGFDSRTVTDYECPYGEAVTYDWTATYTDPGAYVTVYDEQWLSTAAWTVGSGTWNVSGGKLRNTSSTANLSRTMVRQKVRVTIDSFTEATATATQMALYIEDTVTFEWVTFLLSAAGALSVSASGGVLTTLDSTQPITVDFNTSSVTVSGTGGSMTFPVDITPNKIEIQATVVDANGMRVGAVKVQTYGSETPIAETSAPITLDPPDAWLIHVASPGLSVPMSNTTPQVAGIRTFGDVTNETNTTIHKILGSATPIPTTTGPRSDDETSITIYTATTAERTSLRALLADDIPVLIQVPPDWDADFNCGFYQVGDVTYRRDWQWATDRVLDRYVELPLTKVQSPTVDIENSGWSYAAVAVEFATYSALPVTFATYADLASNSRS
jgi:hypothetical protein